jgi:hypothetical protein
VLLANCGCDAEVGTPISANVQSTRSNGYAVLGVAAYPKIQFPQLGLLGQPDSTVGCGATLLVPASKHRSRTRKGLMQVSMSLPSLGLPQAYALGLSTTIFIVKLSSVELFSRYVCSFWDGEMFLDSPLSVYMHLNSATFLGVVI